jgi:hypothetical protein
MSDSTGAVGAVNALTQAFTGLSVSIKGVSAAAQAAAAAAGQSTAAGRGGSVSSASMGTSGGDPGATFTIESAVAKAVTAVLAAQLMHQIGRQ